MVTVTKELQATLQSAVSDARRRRHEYVTLEHLLHAMQRKGAEPAKVRMEFLVLLPRVAVVGPAEERKIAIRAALRLRRGIGNEREI